MIARVREVAGPTLRAAALLLVAGAFAGPAAGGPPNTTHHPEPVALKHWEVYLAGTWATEGADRSGDAPHLEVNYGAAPELQLHLIAPYSYARAAGAATTFGIGDVEVGAKVRLVTETSSRPQVGLFPLVELPTGDADRGLGGGHVRAFLPLWLQKSFGPVQTYGGGGYWINPGAGNRDFWLAGWQAQVQATPFLAPGVEVFYQSPAAEGEGSQVRFNVGLVLDLGESHHVLLSAGRAFHGCDCAQAYAAYLLTLGPGG